MGISAKQYSILSISTLAALALIPICYAVYVDPLQLFHKHFDRASSFSDDIRRQAAGVIHHYEFDSIILGTSVAENFSGEEASEIFGETFVNLSMAASRYVERVPVLEFAVRHEKASSIIYSLDFRYGTNPSEFNPIYPQEKFVHLYDHNPLNDIAIYSEKGFAKCIIGVEKQCPGKWRASLEDLTEWYSEKRHRNRFGGLENWFKAKSTRKERRVYRQIVATAKHIRNNKLETYSPEEALENLLKLKTDFDNNVADQARKHPKSEFYLFFPPYSRLQYALWRQYSPHKFDAYLNTVTHVVNATADIENVRVYGFDDMSFVDDISNYKDLGHYHKKINSKILFWMKAGEHQLTPENVDVYTQTILQLADEFDVNYYGKRMNAYLKSG